MAARSWTTAILLAACSIAVASDTQVFAPRDGVLVLRNGRVLHGRITPLGESYLITIGDGGEACIPRTEVEFDCASLDEGYLIKRDELETDDARSHLALANWCLQQGLLARAADQLLVAAMRSPDDPALKILERQLAARVAQTAQHRVVSYSPTAAAPLPDEPDIEPFLVQQFTTTIQPILFNRCASFACHGGGSSAYRLIRPGSGQVPTSRLTQKNLQATLTYVDRQQPDASRLLTMAQEPHGRVKQAIFHEKTGNQLALLSGWIRRLGIEFSERANRPVPSQKAASKQVVRIPPVSDAKNANDPAAAAESARPGVNPTDPFDPSVFNRQFHSRP
jgi:hypothetical protein